MSKPTVDWKNTLEQFDFPFLKWVCRLPANEPIEQGLKNYVNQYPKEQRAHKLQDRMFCLWMSEAVLDTCIDTVDPALECAFSVPLSPEGAEIKSQNCPAQYGALMSCAEDFGKSIDKK